ncbi:hypothetical protein [Hymenobacter algoricola]|uniref:YceK/YidQ family lipoprotein n=1 Tax=Hymenobacter algoricola TaxID=486267 RepID=A0ABP7NV22_9BACT
MKQFRQFVIIVLATATLSSCATVFGGPVTTYQKTKPAAGQPKRELRVGALVADILLFSPGAIVDFVTGAIYKPQATTK